MKIICDFDGTTAVNDVGNLLFRTFADERCFEIVRDWKTGRINSKTCLSRECEIAVASEKQLLAFADAQPLDPGFKDLVAYAKAKDIIVEIASDGLDFYINRIIAQHELKSEVIVRANHLVFTDADHFKAEFPFFNDGCGECGNCKGYHVKRAQHEGHLVVYVGDGLSDRCGALSADIVFAKHDRDLIVFCQKNNIEFHSYSDIFDVLQQLRAMMPGLLKKEESLNCVKEELPE